MKTKLFAIAKITRATGLKGDVSIRPLIRQFDEYVDRDLFIGFDKNFAKNYSTFFNLFYYSIMLGKLIFAQTRLFIKS